MTIEERLYPRLQCTGSAELLLSPDLPGYVAKIVNLSLRGGLVILDEPVAIDCGTTIELVFKIKQVGFRVRAAVKRMHAENAYGVHFVMMSGRVESNLKELIDELTVEGERASSLSSVKSARRSS